MSTIVIYHDDLDGRCAASLLTDHYPDATYVPIDYHYPSPVGMIKGGDRVFILDYGFNDPRDMMAVMEKTKDIIWIDHHKTTQDKYGADMFKNLPGIRQVGKSGALLTWEFIHPDDNPPTYIELVNDYDLWMLRHEETMLFADGMMIHDTTPKGQIWKTLKEQDPAFMDHLLYMGEVVGAYKQEHYKEYVRRYGYSRAYGEYRCIVINTAKTSTRAFDSVKYDYDVFVSYAYNGERYTVSLYAANDDIDVAEIAKRFGGGGHKGASGFTCKILPDWLK